MEGVSMNTKNAYLAACDRVREDVVTLARARGIPVSVDIDPDIASFDAVIPDTKFN